MNLERSLRVGDRLGGHFVQGHVDTTATLRERRPEGEWEFLAFALDPAWTPLMVPKGSIAVDGVSLTLVDVGPDGFSVMLIPHTLAVTTLGGLAARRPGEHRDRHAGQARREAAASREVEVPDPMPVARQTQSYLRNLFARRGIAPQHRYGQNFLIDLNIHELIVEDGRGRAGRRGAGGRAGGGGADGPDGRAGRGGRRRRDRPGDGAPDGRGGRPGMPNVRVLNVDALANKHTINPEVLDNVRAGLAVAPERRLKLVANLPYNVATPIVTNLLVHPELCPSLMVVTIQLELAERMRAAPGDGRLRRRSRSWSRPWPTCSIVRVLPPSVFWPRPKVDSAVVAITPDPAKRAAIGDLAWFHQVVRQVFLHRRKNLRRVLYSLWRDRWTKARGRRPARSRLGLTGLVRAEAMNVEEFISLTAALKARLGDDKDTRPPIRTTDDGHRNRRRTIDERGRVIVHPIPR